eukprot:COSAG02_NODE_418_length_22698_cov_7.471127_14_plen_164_part_00
MDRDLAAYTSSISVRVLHSLHTQRETPARRTAGLHTVHVYTYGARRCLRTNEFSNSPRRVPPVRVRTRPRRVRRRCRVTARGLRRASVSRRQAISIARPQRAESAEDSEHNNNEDTRDRSSAGAPGSEVAHAHRCATSRGTLPVSARACLGAAARIPQARSAE